MLDAHREARDETTAVEAIRMAIANDKIIGIFVDDDAKVQKMVKRILRLAKEQDLVASKKKKAGRVLVRFDRGEIRVFAADKLSPKA